MRWKGNKENQQAARKAISKADGTTLDPVMSVGGSSGGSHFIHYENGEIKRGSHERRKTKATNRQKPRKR
tara:strand:+ start:380 stop:589 length:210 start_codon:yes stop_codon:yes gene_type:complete